MKCEKTRVKVLPHFEVMLSNCGRDRGGVTIDEVELACDDRGCIKMLMGRNEGHCDWSGSREGMTQQR